ncbi:HD domain-containing phosphohydrolase [Desulfoluna butyratoxydans]|uniref:Signal transduction response regulator receiver domain n=1 Tax=Desulfoluna butyratoxydans TaxID=231438 RepID=A0A4U8YRA2_9BACT|nr:HD domain-containing phosphohydrolase [Desulfoluna butyratoxydans]VFQ45997.1 signal transduction response regulator receiver domain [Desulfoluna butyratoxydans]
MMEKKTVLIVDDMPETTQRLLGLLKDTCTTRTATCSESALQLAASATPPDLILLDTRSADAEAREISRQLKNRGTDQNVPVLVLRSLEEAPAQEDTEGIRDLTAVRDVVLLAMGSLAETRNNESVNHIRRTSRFVKVLAQELSQTPGYREMLTPDTIEMMFRAAPLHDLGKAGVSDSLLLKPGKLTDEEYERVKRHTLNGRDALRNAQDLLGLSAPFLDIACDIAGCHHERWDGSGYPDGLTGEEIPIAARLMALADVYDALVTYRSYKPAFSHGVAVEIIKGGRGTQFAPEVVDAFLAAEQAFQDIVLEFTDFQEEKLAL